MTDEVPLNELPVAWCIDVCATCGRHATWPFCDHRRTDGRWTVGVVVKVANVNGYRTRVEQQRALQVKVQTDGKETQ